MYATKGILYLVLSAKSTMFPIYSLTYIRVCEYEVDH